MASEARVNLRRKSGSMRPWTRPVKNEQRRAMEKRLFQLAIFLGGFVPVLAGLDGALRGTRFIGTWPGQAADSHFRYLSGLLLGIGLIMWGCIPTIERRDDDRADHHRDRRSPAASPGSTAGSSPAIPARPAGRSAWNSSSPRCYACGRRESLEKGLTAKTPRSPRRKRLLRRRRGRTPRLRASKRRPSIRRPWRLGG